MCRSIHTLYNIDPPVTEQEIQEASLQFVRKISGFRKPSIANQAAFNTAVAEIAAISSRLITALETSSPLRERKVVTIHPNVHRDISASPIYPRIDHDDQ